MTTEEIVIILLMGVAGAGKTTIGKLLASELGWEFVDADDHHSPQNIEKMRSGIALTDADRWPWLESLRGIVEKHLQKNTSLVLACSALKQSYRQILQVSPEVKLVYLQGSAQILQQRLESRRGHYMTERMLASQLETLEVPDHAVVINIEQTPPEIVAEIRQQLTAN